MKNPFSKKNRIKILLSATIGALLLFVASTHFANADLFDIGYSFVSTICFGIAYVIAFIAGVIIGIEAWLIGVMLSINAAVFQSSIVQQGFGVTLAIANLGFILGIIVIAIATILRNQTYGMKQILWKLVVMAILINFGLVIMAPIFGFANSLTQYLLNSFNGGSVATGGGVSGSLASDNNFATKLAGAFNPQIGLTSGADTDSGVSAGSSLNGSTVGFNGAFSSAGSDLSKMMIPITSIAFACMESFMVVIVLGVFTFMLLIRYIYIAILAILLPFAWLAWVFPSTKKHWDSWWNEFIRWTFFAPIVIFFLWLAIQTMAAMSKAPADSAQSIMLYTTANGSDSLWTSISNFFSTLFAPVIQNYLNMIIMCGLSVGGLIVANKMSITGAKTGLGAAKGAGKAFGTYAAKRTGRGILNTTSKALNAAANRVAPKTQIHPTYHAEFTPFDTRDPAAIKKAQEQGRRSMKIRGWAQSVSDTAQSSTFKTAGGTRLRDIPGGLAQSVWSGAKSGSGLFGKEKSWQCQSCVTQGLPKPTVIISKQKPGVPCPQCKATAAQAQWKAL